MIIRWTSFGVWPRLRDGTLVRRVLALAMVLDGASRAEAARACGMLDRQTLRDWVHRYNEHGPAVVGQLTDPLPARLS
jgi:transposase-like protein